MRRMSKKRTKPIDQFAAGNSARRMSALADLIIDKQLTLTKGARKIHAEFGKFIAAAKQGSHGNEEEAGMVVYSLGVGLSAALKQLNRRGPVLVRVIDQDAITTWLMPKGPPN